MRSKTALHVPDDTAQERIISLLNDLPPEGIAVAEQFVRFLHDVVQQGSAAPTVISQAAPSVVTYPSIGLPPATLQAWSDLIAEGYTGDALTDTEALYEHA